MNLVSFFYAASVCFCSFYMVFNNILTAIWIESWRCQLFEIAGIFFVLGFLFLHFLVISTFRNVGCVFPILFSSSRSFRVNGEAFAAPSHILHYKIVLVVWKHVYELDITQGEL